MKIVFNGAVSNLNIKLEREHFLAWPSSYPNNNFFFIPVSLKFFWFFFPNFCKSNCNLSVNDVFFRKYGEPKCIMKAFSSKDDVELIFDEPIHFRKKIQLNTSDFAKVVCISAAGDFWLVHRISSSFWFFSAKWIDIIRWNIKNFKGHWHNDNSTKAESNKGATGNKKTRRLVGTWRLFFRLIFLIF